jgi:hypothetical protein
MHRGGVAIPFRSARCFAGGDIAARCPCRQAVTSLQLFFRTIYPDPPCVVCYDPRFSPVVCVSLLDWAGLLGNREPSRRFPGMP